MEEYHIELSGFKLKQKRGLQSTTLDSMLIADFVKINNKTKNVLEIGSGFGIISMLIARRSKAKVLGVEINKEAFDISLENIENNDISNLKFLNFDIKDYKEKFLRDSFDIIVSNPPYFKENIKNQMKKEKELINARNEKILSIKDIINISSYLLKNKASLYIIFRSERLFEVFSYLIGTNLVIKRLKPIYTKVEDEKSLITMIEIVKDAKEGLILENPIYVYKKDGRRNEYIERLYK